MSCSVSCAARGRPWGHDRRRWGEKPLTITLDDEVYRGLHQKVGRGQISRFIADLVRPHVVEGDALEAAYRLVAADRGREEEALAWIEFAPDEGLG